MEDKVFPSLALLLVFTANVHSGQWLAVKDTVSETYTQVLVISPRREYSLRPECALVGARIATGCRPLAELSLRLRYWTNDALVQAREALLASGHCRPADPCRVLPFEALRVRLRDQNGHWEQSQGWHYVAGLLPSHQRFSLRRRLTVREMTGNCSDMRSRSLSPSEISALEGLYVEAVSRTQASGGPVGLTRNLTFTSDDIQWAADRLRLKVSRLRPNIVDRNGLRQLALSLLRTRKRSLEALSGTSGLTITPSVLTKMQMALMARSDEYSRELSSMVVSRRRPISGEMVYVLKGITASVHLPAEEPSSSVTNRISITTASVGTRVENDSATSPRGRIGKDSGSQPAIEELQRELASLKQLVMTRFNIPANVSDEYLNLVNVDDCREVKQRGLKPGVFFLTAVGRPVLCTAAGELVALKRSLGNVNFDRTWADYVSGFGDARRGDYWIGLRYLARYTSDGDCCMSLQMSPYRIGVTTRVARYSGFRIGGPGEQYRLQYGSFDGTVHSDALKVSRNQAFSTANRDQDAFSGNCAAMFRSGNWYSSCYEANLFGPLLHPVGSDRRRSVPGGKNSSTMPEGMCWRGVHKGQPASLCSPLSSVTMLVSRAADRAFRKKVVLSLSSGCDCTSQLQEVKINETAKYTLTVGGGGGGYAFDDGNIFHPGGRGAAVRSSLVLNKGTRLGVVVGCSGRLSNKIGHGGDATFVTDRTRGLLLVAAGGGGGASRRVSGRPGRASQIASDAWWTACHRNSSVDQRLRRKFPRSGLGWQDVRDKLLGSATSGVVKSGGAPNRNGGGGGGGYAGGGTGYDTLSPGGGGGSYCNETVAASCSLEEGDNDHFYGFLLLEQHFCM